MKNFNEGQDYLNIHGLAGLPTANTLFVWLTSVNEAGVSPTTTFGGGTVTQVGTTVITRGSLTSSARKIDLGQLDFTAAASGSPTSVVITTVTPGGASPLLLAIQDINSGSAINLATQGPLIIDDLTLEIAYLVSGTVA